MWSGTISLTTDKSSSLVYLWSSSGHALDDGVYVEPT